MPRSLAQEQDILKRPMSKRPPRLTSREGHAQGRPFQELLQYYAIERFLYRLAQSSHCDKFILKGALLLTVWQAPFSRSTVDIDLLGKTSNKLEHIASLVSEICGLDVEADGVKFDPASIKTARIKEDADYEGIRVRFRATLAWLPGPLFDECREVLEPSDGVVMRFGISVARRQIYHAVVESTNEEQTCYTDALIKTATSIQSSTRSTCCATAQTL